MALRAPLELERLLARYPRSVAPVTAAAAEHGGGAAAAERAAAARQPAWPGYPVLAVAVLEPGLGPEAGGAAPGAAQRGPAASAGGRQGRQGRGRVTGRGGRWEAGCGFAA